MWPFTKKISLEQSGLFQGFTDWHSHILPGVDDGFQKMEDSLAALQKYEELGVKSVWLTPHIMEECRNTTQGLRDRFAELQAEYQGPIQLQLAAENMLDSLFEERFQANDLLTIGPGGNYLLVETSYVNPPYGMENMMQQIMSTGLTPILAHPERYRYMEQDDYTTWKERGVVFQTNFMSLVGMYGETARSKAEWLLKEGLIDITGSDLHHYRVLLHFIDHKPKNQQALDSLVEIAGNPKILIQNT